MDVKKIIRYLTGIVDFDIEFETSSQLVVSAFFYVDWSSRVDTRRSTSGIIMLSVNHMSHFKTKHMDLDYHFITEKVIDKEIAVQYVPSCSIE